MITIFRKNGVLLSIKYSILLSFRMSMRLPTIKDMIINVYSFRKYFKQACWNVLMVEWDDRAILRVGHFPPLWPRSSAWREQIRRNLTFRLCLYRQVSIFYSALCWAVLISPSPLLQLKKKFWWNYTVFNRTILESEEIRFSFTIFPILPK